MVTSSRRNGGSSPHEGGHCIIAACDAEIFVGQPSNEQWVIRGDEKNDGVPRGSCGGRPLGPTRSSMVSHGLWAGDSRDQFYRPHIGHPTAGIRATLERRCVCVCGTDIAFSDAVPQEEGFGISYWTTSRRPRAGQNLELEPAAQDDLICDAGVVRGPDRGLKW